jgi:hypothetical protein
VAGRYGPYCPCSWLSFAGWNLSLDRPALLAVLWRKG